MKNKIIILSSLYLIVLNGIAQTKTDSTSIKNQQLINGIKNRINTIENIGNPDYDCTKKVNDLTVIIKAQQDTIAALKKKVEEDNLSLQKKYTNTYINNKTDKELNSELNHNDLVNKNIGDCKCIRLFFKPYQTELNYKEFTQVDSIINICKSKPNVKLKLVGHADKTGDEPTNLELSKKRVLALKQYLMASTAINSDKIITEWYGSTIPSQDASSPDKQFLNRRLEIILIE